MSGAKAVLGGDSWRVEFDDATVIECSGQVEAEALAEAWQRWPESVHPPAEEARNRWRTGFADGAAWQASRAPDPLGDAAQ